MEEHDAHHPGCPGTGGDPDDVRRGQLVAQQGLEDDAGDAEGAAGQDREGGAGQAQLADGVGRAGHGLSGDDPGHLDRGVEGLADHEGDGDQGGEDRGESE